MNMQDMQSNNIGEIIRINLVNSIYDSAFIQALNIKVPISVEPTSPIKTFAGNLLKKKKLHNEPIIGM